MTAQQLAHELRKKSGTPPLVIDVRTGPEFCSGHIPGALHAPTLKILFRRVPLPADKGSLLVITCEHGPRAYLAAKLLGRFGYRNITLLEGHMAGWRRGGLPLER